MLKRFIFLDIFILSYGPAWVERKKIKRGGVSSGGETLRVVNSQEKNIFLKEEKINLIEFEIK
jgi:hypothetical protein